MATAPEIIGQEIAPPEPSNFVVRSLNTIDAALVLVCMLATIAAGLVLTYSVIVRSWLRWSTDWQDEISVFLLVAATFLSASYVQSVRGHIAIGVLQGFLPERLNRIRLVLIDLICLLFVGVFTWQSWLLFLEAVASGEVTDSAWAPPLWIPYSFMTFGMTLLALRMLLQLAQGVATAFSRGGR
jgi:TRAP-type C4-dicarboxylate transport system permease small subunit